MAVFDNPALPPDSALRVPAARRISLPVSQRLQTITEGNPGGAPPIPPRSSRRPSNTSAQSLPARSSVAVAHPPTSVRSASTETPRTAPPPYTWIAEPFDFDDDEPPSNPSDDEKFAALRRGVTHRGKKGGWWRLALVIALVLLAIIGLAVGLGVGLTVGKSGHDGGDQSSSPSPGSANSSTAPYPLGDFSVETALKEVDTNCTSNAATWNCYPYVVFDPSDASSASGSLTTFNWIITNTSATYATNATASTGADGIPANLSISTADNPFTLSFTNQSMTYISESSNSSSPRYTFSFSMQKPVTPRIAITTDNTAAVCFYNQTTFTASLYLSAPQDYPSAEPANSGREWPYAVDVMQTSPGGQDVPACYEFVNGEIGARITAGLSAQADDTRCVCDYRNF